MFHFLNNFFNAIKFGNNLSNQCNVTMILASKRHFFLSFTRYWTKHSYNILTDINQCIYARRWLTNLISMYYVRIRLGWEKLTTFETLSNLGICSYVFPYNVLCSDNQTLWEWWMNNEESCCTIRNTFLLIMQNVRVVFVWSYLHS